jgi:chromosome segregation ATPase
MAVPTVTQGTVETESGKVFEFDSFKTSVWLETLTSFRFEPTGASKPYTVRKESRPGGSYWYGYRKVAGKLHKKYIGKTPELNTRKLEEIAEALNIPPQQRVAHKVTHQVDSAVTHEIVDSSPTDRLTALESQVQALQDSFKALRQELVGKSERLGEEDIESPLKQELENWKAAVFTQTEQIDSLTEQNTKLRKNFLQAEGDTDRAVQRFVKAEAEVQRLHTELGNLKTENEWLKQKFAESRDTVETLNWGTEALNEELQVLRAENEALRATQPATEFKPPEAAELLNQLKAKRKKVTASLADVEAILEILEG